MNGPLRPASPMPAAMNCGRSGDKRFHTVVPNKIGTPLRCGLHCTRRWPHVTKNIGGFVAGRQTAVGEKDALSDFSSSHTMRKWASHEFATLLGPGPERLSVRTTFGQAGVLQVIAAAPIKHPPLAVVPGRKVTMKQLGLLSPPRPQLDPHTHPQFEVRLSSTHARSCGKPNPGFPKKPVCVDLGRSAW